MDSSSVCDDQLDQRCPCALHRVCTACGLYWSVQLQSALSLPVSSAVRVGYVHCPMSSKLNESTGRNVTAPPVRRSRGRFAAPPVNATPPHTVSVRRTPSDGAIDWLIIHSALGRHFGDRGAIGPVPRAPRMTGHARTSARPSAVLPATSVVATGKLLETIRIGGRRCAAVHGERGARDISDPVGGSAQ